MYADCNSTETKQPYAGRLLADGELHRSDIENQLTLMQKPFRGPRPLPLTIPTMGLIMIIEPLRRGEKEGICLEQRPTVVKMKVGLVHSYGIFEADQAVHRSLANICNYLDASNILPSSLGHPQARYPFIRFRWISHSL